VKAQEAALAQSIANLLKQEEEVKVCSRVPYHFGGGCRLVAGEIRFSFALPQITGSKAFLVPGWFLRHFLGLFVGGG